MKWDDIPASFKLTAVTVPVLAAMVVWLFANFETVSASEQRWSYHNLAITCKTISDKQAEIRSLTERLQFDNTLTDLQRDWIKQQIINIQAEIRRLDSNGQC